jgi:hypothetical protein
MGGEKMMNDDDGPTDGWLLIVCAWKPKAHSAAVALPASHCRNKWPYSMEASRNTDSRPTTGCKESTVHNNKVLLVDINGVLAVVL